MAEPIYFNIRTHDGSQLALLNPFVLLWGTFLLCTIIRNETKRNTFVNISIVSRHWQCHTNWNVRSKIVCVLFIYFSFAFKCYKTQRNWYMNQKYIYMINNNRVLIIIIMMKHRTTNDQFTAKHRIFNTGRWHI